MSENIDSKPSQSQGGQNDKGKQGYGPPPKPTPPPPGGEYDKEKQGYEPPPPPPPPPPCPDPCDEPPPKWGPPEIRPECCPPHECCDDEQHCCTWDEVDDPCVRAASADCVGTNWAKIECKCESSNAECGCEEWDCGGYPQGTCVPCTPCEGLITDPPQPTGPVTDDCTSENLGNQLEALNRSISSQQGEKAKLEAEIKAKGERATALKELIKSFDDIVKKYREQRFNLICKENCLKGFYRDVSSVFVNSKDLDVTALTEKINHELCLDELAKCCQKNLEGKLTKTTKLIWEQQQAETKMKKADQAFTITKDLPKWIEDRFKELETLKDEIDKALNDKVDPQKEKWAFYLFYWKFVPKLCKCFPFPFCCDEKPAGETEEQNPQQTQQGQNKQNQNQQKPPARLGCKPGDWHPSAIDEDLLKALICCAWEYARKRKEEYLKASDNVASATNNLDFIKKKVEADAKTLEDRIKSALDKVKKLASTST